jgi:hypothetical protein
MSLWLLWVIDSPSTIPLSSISLIEVPNNFEMSDADDDATKEADNEVQIPNTAASAKKSAHAKHKAKGILSLQKSPRFSSSSISSKGENRGRKTIQNMQLIIEECKFKAESEWEERKIRMLEQELTMNMEKLKVETKHSN